MSFKLIWNAKIFHIQIQGFNSQGDVVAYGVKMIPIKTQVEVGSDEGPVFL